MSCRRVRDALRRGGNAERSLGPMSRLAWTISKYLNVTEHLEIFASLKKALQREASRQTLTRNRPWG